MVGTTQGGEMSQGHESSGPHRSEGRAERSAVYIKKHHEISCVCTRSVSGCGGDVNSMVSTSIFECAFGPEYTH